MATKLEISVMIKWQNKYFFMNLKLEIIEHKHCMNLILLHFINFLELPKMIKQMNFKFSKLEERMSALLLNRIDLQS